MKRIKFLLYCFFISANLSLVNYSQSARVENPTPITSNFISGKIKARDIGDPRATVHYYVFEGNQGDILLKIESLNLNGDIDIFYADNLRPLTKITLYAESTSTETGREIYLRKTERLILRVEGRTPTDEPATYSIRFDGSFVALNSTKPGESPTIQSNNSENESEIKVNSVGTILETKAKPTPTPKETVARNSNRRRGGATTVPEPVSTIKPKTTSKKEIKKNEVKEVPVKKIEVVVTDNLPKSENEKIEDPENKTEIEKNKTEPKTTKKTNSSTRKTTVKKETPPKTSKPNPREELETALENIRLVVDFKDGTKIERPMNEVVRFGVDKGVLTIVNKNGSIGRYSILEITKITIE